MKVSEITLEDLVNYLKLDLSSLEEGEKKELNIFLNVAKKFIGEYTGLNAAEIDEHEDIVIAVYVLCEDMYDNRQYTVDKNNVNKLVSTILDMHCDNLI